ncbi:very short patch repair endonuclease [Mycobacterium sp. ITM-2016-00318]|uniref:very short patch repair endonuclease n=1 Tax=Mycobacterium sp. ITM-2016-00318 TaxID=2099693 RepID=UPI001E2CB123|nr:very short patch repair endonuclease [Mycobacterium sp. ITM-2016-00318]WNG93676.1 very short patch repair endonuclease [Mycobacterium sp. ITM-2016-00318]
MGDSWASSRAVRASMRGNRRRDTRPELALRRHLHAMGLRYRVDFAPLQEARRLRADIVFTRARVAVFIDGCFWHKCPYHYRPARSNADFWTAKIEGNHQRDALSNAALRDAGWTVLRFWEHETVDHVAPLIAAAVTAAQPNHVESELSVPARCAD